MGYRFLTKYNFFLRHDSKNDNRQDLKYLLNACVLSLFTRNYS